MSDLRGTADQNGTSAATFGNQQDPLQLNGAAQQSGTNATTPIALSENAQRRVNAEDRRRDLRTELDDQEIIASGQNLREPAVQSNQTQSDDTQPFAPVGFRMGSSVVNMRLEQSVGYSTNLAQSSGGSAGAFSRTEITVGLVSDWSRHELRVDASAVYRKPFSSDIDDQPTADISTALRLDLVDGFTTTIGTSYGFSTESLTSDNLTGGVSERPGIHTYGGSVEVARTGRRLNFLLRGTVDRTDYEEAALGSGGALDQVDRNSTLYAVTARAGYDYGAFASPFVEARVGARRYDEEVDRNGEQRNSMIYDLRAGYEFDAGDKLNGEISVGYLREEFDEGDLDALNGVSINGTLNWSPERDTTVIFTAATALNSSTTAGNNGTVQYTTGVDITRQATDRLSLNLNAGAVYDYNDQERNADLTWTLGIGAEYWLNRYMALTADIDHRVFEDGDGVNDYDETVGTVGLVLQR